MTTSLLSTTNFEWIMTRRARTGNSKTTPKLGVPTEAIGSFKWISCVYETAEIDGERESVLAKDA